ncbi:MAG: TonB-dependent receptor [Ignavibacteriales bacterium CG07_land_8_20_14_0_80_59_12]|nr:MAG: TonB-dependent receptor [Ignavibacteriales bacterium CG07_land_8_20_14_0_80_59_12]
MRRRYSSSIVVAILTTVLLPVWVFAGTTGSIKGIVIDVKTKEPLIGVNVVIEGTTLGAATAPDGSYVIIAVPGGKYKLMASMMGYMTVVKNVEVRAGGTVTVDFELKENVLELGAVVVSGTRTPHFIKDAPVRTEVITARMIEQKAAPNLYEALEGVPGIRVEQQCSYCNFSIVRMQGMESGHCQVLIDGQPIYSGLAGVYGLQQLPTANIERIEVVKGAGSALYGSSAIAGVINIITKQPTAEPFIEAACSFGTANTNNYTLAASRKVGTMDVMVTAQKNTANEIDEDGDGFTDRVKSDNLALGLMLNAYNILGDDRLSFTGRTLNESRQGGELATWENPFAPSAENIKTTRYETGIGYKNRFRYGNEITLNFGYTLHHRNATNDAFLGDYEAIHGTLPTIDEMQPYLADENLYVVDFNYSHPFASHRLLGGVQYSHNKLEETGRYVIVDDTDPDYGGTYTSESEKHADDLGAYLQDEVAISDALELVLGARYDIHHSQDNFGGSGKVAPRERIKLDYDEQAFSPRFAVRLKASPKFTLRGSVGTGFRVPYGFSEDLHLCSGSPRVNKPAGLKPEKSVSFNLGADYSGERFTANANLFRTNLHNKIGFTDASEVSKRMGYTYEWDNIGDAYTQGIELGATALLVRDLVFDLNLAYTDAQYENERQDWVENHPEYAEDSKYIPRVPKITAGIGLTYTPGNWDLALNWDYTGRMYIDYYKDEDIEQQGSKIVHTPDFFVVNAKIARSFSNGVTLSVGAKNLFDYVQKERHRDNAAFMYAPYTGRIIYGGVKLKL